MTAPIDVMSAEDTQQAISRVNTLVVGARLACGADQSDMIASLMGAIVVIARAARNPDEVIAAVQAALGAARRKLAENGGAGPGGAS